MANAKKTAKPATKKTAKPATKKTAKKDTSLPASYYRGQKKGTKPQRDSGGFIIPG